MLNINENWYTELWQDDCAFSIKIEEKLATKQSKFQLIEFYKSKTFGTFFTIDGLMMVNEKDEFIYHEMIVHPAFLANPNIKKVLIIGGGDGGSAREVLKYKTVEHVDFIDIDEDVFRMCQKFLPITASGIEEDSRCNIEFRDGVEVVKNASDNEYDLIIVDSTDPISIGEGLFTTNFYNDCYRILNKDGILINQHESPYFEDYADSMKKAHHKINKIFPISDVYQFHIPTYPSGHWLFGFSSKSINPKNVHDTKAWDELGIKTKYFNTDIQKASLSLPNYAKEMLENE
ncbi:MAG: polyamine aminopropyltransferase [Mycoplasmatales bacterium]